MRILVLGAAGRAGRAVTSSLLTLSRLERILIADNNAEGLSQLSTDVAPLPASPRFLDAESLRSLKDRMAEADLVVGCLGPFHLHEGRIVEAAIETRRDYISLCDDPGATAEVLSLKEYAEDRGVGILCGCGISPGLSNLLARRAGSHIDRPAVLELAWYIEPGSRLGGATLDHLLRSLSGKTPSFINGRETEVRAGSWEEYIEFPPPVGWRAVSFLGHPEPLTLPGNMLEVSEVRFKGSIGTRGKSLALQTLGWMGGNAKSELRDVLLRALARPITSQGNGSCLSAIRVTASDGQRRSDKKSILAVVGDYYHVSSLVIMAAVEQWAMGRWPSGVHSPEEVLDDPAIFYRLRAYGLRFLTASEEM